MSEMPSTIGSARMDDEGTIFLQLLAETPDLIGDALLTYKTDHPNYKAIIDHLPDLKPGKEVLVPPFPSDE